MALLPNSQRGSLKSKNGQSAMVWSGAKSAGDRALVSLPGWGHFGGKGMTSTPPGAITLRAQGASCVGDRPMLVIRWMTVTRLPRSASRMSISFWMPYAASGLGTSRTAFCLGTSRNPPGSVGAGTWRGPCSISTTATGSLSGA